MTELTPAYSKAVELNRKIIINAQIAQQAIFDMGIGLKTMRDEKLYKELGYQNFEDYCENEVEMSRQNAYKYIHILENVSLVRQNDKIGFKKLYLLSTLTDDEQTEISDRVDVESITCTRLEKEITELKKSRDALNDTLDLRDENIRKLKDELESLRKTIDELENRPIPVEYSSKDDDSYHLNDRKLAETIASLERNNIEQNENLARQYEEQNKETERRLIEEKEQAVAVLKAEYEAKFAELKEAQRNPKTPDDKEVFKAYFATAADGCKRLFEYANGKANPLYIQKIREFVNELLNNIPEVK